MNSSNLQNTMLVLVDELKSPEPIWDVNNDKYFTYPVQSSVGCPFNCSFCAVNKHMENLKLRT